MTVRLHTGETIGPGLLGSIVSQAGISVGELRAVLRQDERDAGLHARGGTRPGRRLFRDVAALPGCFTRGSTIEQCRERAVEAIEVRISGLRADGEPVPEEVGPPPQLLAVTVAA